MSRRLPASHAQAPLLERSEISLVSGEISLEDFAFADTVMVPDLPLPQAADSYRAALPTYAEIPSPPSSMIAWNADASHVSHAEAPVSSGLRGHLSSYEWAPGDLLRAAWMGLAMLVLIATVATVALTR